LARPRRADVGDGSCGSAAKNRFADADPLKYLRKIFFV
jgi:hypothetical protein